MTSLSVAKIGQTVIIIAVILTIIFYILAGPSYSLHSNPHFKSQNLNPANIDNKTELQKQYPFGHIFNRLNLINNINNTNNIKNGINNINHTNNGNINNVLQYDYNQLFSNYIKKDYDTLSSSKKKLIMIFVIGLEGFGHNLFSLIFNELTKIYLHRIIHLIDSHELSIYLDECWSFESWGLSHTNNIFTHWPICDMIQEKFNNYSASLKSGDILLLSSSFSLLHNTQYPDIVKLVEWTQNAKPYPIDLRLVILNQDYKQSLSVCLQSNDCKQRMPLMTHMLNAMHTQIIQIDPQFWIQINYTHFIQNPMEYTNIFKTLFNLEEDKINTAIITSINNLYINNTINTNNTNNNTKNIGKQFNELQSWAIHQSYYSSHVKNRWPLFGNKTYYAPKTSINYNDLYSNFIKKDYDLLNKSKKKLTMVFIVGVEGVGHHFFRSILNELNDRIDGKHYVHQNDRPWPQDPLWLILDQCWAFDLWGIIKPPSWLTVDISFLPKTEQNISCLHSGSLCAVSQKRINEYSNSMNNNSVLFISTHYSFPYDDPIVNRYPDFVQLIEWAQNAKPYPFDIRILILKRDYKTSIISTCIKRFGSCTQRIPLLSNMLNVIHSQLLQIDQQFWLQINYTDLVNRMFDYVDILSTFFNVKLKDFEKAMEATNNIYQNIKRNKKRNGNKKQPKLTKQQLWAINDAYYTSHVMNRWPLFNNDHYIVGPGNDKFLRQKLFVNKQYNGSVIQI